jgi:hypothetical protein
VMQDILPMAVRCMNVKNAHLSAPLAWITERYLQSLEWEMSKNVHLVLNPIHSCTRLILNV